MKVLIYVGIGAGGLIGGYLPVVFWHADAFGAAGIIGSTIGSLAGIWIAYKIGKYYGM